MTQPNKAAEERLAALETRVTQIEQRLTAAIDQFSPTAGRVAELSSAFQAANARLRILEQSMETLEGRLNQEAPDSRLDSLDALIVGIQDRVSQMETQRARGGRLSARLAGIEAALERIENGGTDGTEQ